MDDYENYYNEAIKEIRRLRIVVREYQEDINLLNAFIDSRCKIDGISETIQTLKSLGATEQLLSRIEEINKQISFIDDKAKMYDFTKLSKCEFLKSYSYLTEYEYNATQYVYDNMNKEEKEIIDNITLDSGCEVCCKQLPSNDESIQESLEAEEDYEMD
ncbi:MULTISPECIES: hypothetical protein [Bacteria]|uniref:hypothetical protein n=1 Tax=Bacteria TaxID=2 RepID=UPI001C3D1152|nr:MULTISPECIES: hypothetical protein [Bacteria]GJM59255.1 hypothetical protein EROP_29480 [Erysipelotrichaceae bacterium OPF54]